MSKGPINLQDGYLNQARKDSIPVTIYLINGFKLRGLVQGFDNFTIVLETDGRQQLVYKHAISTISPAEPIQPIYADKKEPSDT